MENKQNLHLIIDYNLYLYAEGIGTFIVMNRYRKHVPSIYDQEFASYVRTFPSWVRQIGRRPDPHRHGERSEAIQGSGPCPNVAEPWIASLGSQSRVWQTGKVRGFRPSVKHSQRE